MAETLDILELEEVSGGKGGTVEPRYIHYVVRKYDTLASIAKQYKVRVEDLMHANYIKDANMILAGKEILVPNVNRK